VMRLKAAAVNRGQFDSWSDQPVAPCPFDGAVQQPLWMVSFCTVYRASPALVMPISGPEVWGAEHGRRGNITSPQARYAPRWRAPSAWADFRAACDG
jgi:hypothetical protein